MQGSQKLSKELSDVEVFPKCICFPLPNVSKCKFYAIRTHLLKTAIKEDQKSRGSWL